MYKYTLATVIYFLPFQMHQHYLNDEGRVTQRHVEIDFDKLADLITEEVSLLLILH